MQDINKITVTGTIYQDPKTSVTQKNVTMARFTVGVRRIGSKSIDFLNVIAWEAIADKVKEEFHAGDHVEVEGSLQNQKYTGSDGIEKRDYRILAANVALSNDATEQEIV